MAYDQALADRIRAILADEEGVTEREMLGGLDFLLNGNLLGGPRSGTLLLRVGPDAYDEAVAEPEARAVNLMKFPMRGFVEISADDLDDDERLAAWLARCLAFARSLDPK